MPTGNKYGVKDIGPTNGSSLKIVLASPNQGFHTGRTVSESPPHQRNLASTDRLQAMEEGFPEWLDLRTLVRYASVSERTLRLWIHRDHDPLPAVRITGKVLVNRHRFDEWLTAHALKPAGSVDITSIVNDLVKKVSGAD